MAALLGAHLCCAGAATAANSGGSGEEITLVVPAQAPSSACTPVADGSRGASVSLRRTFSEDFDQLDLASGRWTPHYDGGYDEKAKKWLGYDWKVKRTAPAGREQEIYVDPGYQGTAPSALGLNPFGVEKGILSIVARQTPPELRQYLYGFDFISGLLTTRKSFVQRYGYFEMRARVPSGKALLPAFWLLPWDKSWPPELDVMEAPGHEPGKIVTTVHWNDDNGRHKASGCRTLLPSFSKDFRQYGALWTPERVVYYIDRRPVAQVETPPGMDKPMYMLINLAVGGDWVGRADPGTPLSAVFEVDWVAAYTQGDPGMCAITPSGVKLCPGK